MPTGILKRWLGDKGFGFIMPDDNSGDLFAHIRQKAGDPNEVGGEGRRVYFESDFDLKKGKPNATTWYFVDGGVPQAPQQTGIVGTASFPSVNRTMLGQHNSAMGQLSGGSGGVGYQALVQAATAVAAAMAGQGGGQNVQQLNNIVGLAAQQHGHMQQSSIVQQMVPPSLPPPPQAPQVAVEEIEVPALLMALVVGVGGSYLEEIKRRVGGDVEIELGGGDGAEANSATRTLKVRGPPVSASLGACLLLQRVSEAM